MTPAVLILAGSIAFSAASWLGVGIAVELVDAEALVEGAGVVDELHAARETRAAVAPSARAERRKVVPDRTESSIDRG